MKKDKCAFSRYKIILLLALIFLINFTSTLYIFAYTEKTLSFGEAILLGVKNSRGIKDTRLELVKKQIELKEAKEALADIRKKESTVRFSLLLNIKMPEKHALPKEIELVMKIPTIESKIAELNKKLVSEKQNTQFSAENAYLETVELMDSVDKNKTLLENLKSAVKRIEADYIMGNASKEDYEYLKKEIDKQTSKYAKEVLRYENSKKKLGKIVGTDIAAGYTFSKDFTKVELTRDNLDEIIAFSINNDFELFKAVQARKIAERKLSELRSIYNNRWGDMVSIIEQELQKQRPGETIDYASFLEKYRQALDNIEAPWKDSYEVNMLFFTISIPKDWLKGEYDGIRYFEDQKYALYLALIDRDKAIEAEEQTKQELIKKIEDTYLAVKEFEMAYMDSIKLADSTKEAYKKAKALNMLGKVSFKDLENARNSAVENETAAFSSLIKYNKAISMFNFNSSGKIDTYKEAASFTRNSYESGNSLINKDQGMSYTTEKPEWFLKVSSTELLFEFGLNIPENSGITATHYTLSTTDDVTIGGKTEMTKTILHLPIAFKNTTKLVLRLYNKDTVIYKAEIDGLTYGGELELEKIPPVEPETVLGSWEIIPSNDLVSTLTLKLDSSSGQIYKSYSLRLAGAKENETSAPLDIGTPWVHLSLITKKADSIIVCLHKNDGSIDEAVLLEKDNKKIIVKK